MCLGRLHRDFITLIELYIDQFEDLAEQIIQGKKLDWSDTLSLLAKQYLLYKMNNKYNYKNILYDKIYRDHVLIKMNGSDHNDVIRIKSIHTTTFS